METSEILLRTLSEACFKTLLPGSSALAVWEVDEVTEQTGLSLKGIKQGEVT